MVTAMAENPAPTTATSYFMRAPGCPPVFENTRFRLPSG
jgi:hypothetical protein